MDSMILLDLLVTTACCFLLLDENQSSKQ